MGCKCITYKRHIKSLPHTQTGKQTGDNHAWVYRYIVNWCGGPVDMGSPQQENYVMVGGGLKTYSEQQGMYSIKILQTSLQLISKLSKALKKRKSSKLRATQKQIAYLR
jgi:hypothetical protein